MELFREVYPTAFHAKFLEHDLRADGRGKFEVRSLAAVAGNLSSTLGSSFARLGRTAVVVGIKGELVRGERKKKALSDVHKAPVSEAGVEVHVELSSVCSGERPGLPSGFALFLQETLRHTLCERGREMVAREQLVVDGARDAGWALTADVYCVDDDGAVLDAALAGLVAALEHTTLPPLAWNGQAGRFEQTGAPGVRLVVSRRPSALSFALVDRWMVADPSHAEEAVAAAVVTVIRDADGRLAAVEKRGGTAISRAQLAECIDSSKR